jgi:hypothetical protein
MAVEPTDRFTEEIRPIRMLRGGSAETVVASGQADQPHIDSHFAHGRFHYFGLVERHDWVCIAMQ